MDHVAVEDVVISLIEKIEENTGKKKTQKPEERQKRIHPAVNDGKMVDGKSESAHSIGEKSSCPLLQLKKCETSEEKLFKKGIDEGYVEGNDDKVVFRDHHIRSHGAFNGFKVDEVPDEDIQQKKGHVDQKTEKK